MAHHIGRELTGPAGYAFEIIVDEPLTPDQSATVACWFLRCPGQSPLWDCYTLSAIHLRDIPGVRPAIVRVPHATHEIMLLALEPENQKWSLPAPHPNDQETWRFLRPINLSEQLQLPSDEAAVDLLHKCAEGVLAGVLWAEPPLSGQVEPWRTSLLKSAAHLRGEEHAP